MSGASPVRPLAVALLLVAAPALAGVSGRGVEFWGAWPRSHASLEASAVLVVMAAEPTDVLIDGAFDAQGVADEGQPWIVPVPPTLRTALERTPADVGFRVRSADGFTPLNVLFRVPEQAEASDDMARLLPVSELGTRYVVTAWGSSVSVAPSYYVVIATEDATTVNTTTPCGGDTGPVLLDAGQVYQAFCRVDDTPRDVTGAVISADKPVAVLAGAAAAWIPGNFLSGDFIVEALAPVEEWGTEFYVAPLPKGPDAGDPRDILRITASAPAQVTLDDGTSPRVLPLTGEGAWAEADLLLPLRIAATAPVDVQLYATGHEASGIGDPFQATVPPTDAWTLFTRAYLPPDYTQGGFVDLFAPVGSADQVRFAGQPVGGWTPLPGATHAWARIEMGLFSGTRLVTAPEGAGVLVFGFNDAYAPDPDLGRVPGSYGYPAANAVPVCRIEARGGPDTGCPGEFLDLDDAGSVIQGCVNVEYRWLQGGVPVPGCSFSPFSSCTVLYTGPVEYLFEARCADNPTDCAPGTHLVQVTDAPPLEVRIEPDPAEVCIGQEIDLLATSGFERYEWSSAPADPGVTPRVTAVPFLTASPEEDTVYTVEGSGGTACRGSDDLQVVVLPDPVPPPVGKSLLVERGEPGRLVLKWTDLAADPVSGYEPVSHLCPSRRSCPAPPSPGLLDGLPGAAPPVGPALGILGLNDPGGDLVFFKIRALSPCAGLPGTACDGFPAQVPCP